MRYNRYVYQFAGIVLDVEAQRPQLKAPQTKKNADTIASDRRLAEARNPRCGMARIVGEPN